MQRCDFANTLRISRYASGRMEGRISVHQAKRKRTQQHPPDTLGEFSVRTEGQLPLRAVRPRIASAKILLDRFRRDTTTTEPLIRQVNFDCEFRDYRNGNHSNPPRAR